MSLKYKCGQICWQGCLKSLFLQYLNQTLNTSEKFQPLILVHSFTLNKYYTIKGSISVRAMARKVKKNSQLSVGHRAASK